MLGIIQNWLISPTFFKVFMLRIMSNNMFPKSFKYELVPKLFQCFRRESIHLLVVSDIIQCFSCRKSIRMVVVPQHFSYIDCCFHGNLMSSPALEIRIVSFVVVVALETSSCTLCWGAFKYN